MRSVAAEWGVDVTTLRRIVEGAAIAPGTLARLERIVERRRTADEFKSSAARPALQPLRFLPTTSWTLETIRAARDSQMLGWFRLPSRLASMLLTDDAMFDAFHKRIAPQSAVAVELKPARDSARARAVQAKADRKSVV